MTISAPEPDGDFLAGPLEIGALPVRVETAEAELAGRVADWLARALCGPGTQESPSTPLRLRIHPGEPIMDLPASARKLCASPTWRVLRDDRRVFLLFPNASSMLDLSAGFAELRLAEGWWREPLKTQQDPWILTLVWLLRERGRYALHASAVARGGRGLLIAGDSGSGKSSTALSLIQAGWDWLADDVVLLEPDAPPRLHALARGFAFHTTLAERMPGLVGEVAGDKRSTQIEDIFPGRQLPSCRPAALLFPRVADQEASLLDRLSPAEALMALLPASGGILASSVPGQSQAQLTALRDLATEVPAYRLHAGRDIFGDGSALEALLGTHGVALGR